MEERTSASTNTKWEGRWDQLKGRVRQMWGNLSDDDFDRAQGNWEMLVGRIKERTGMAGEEIERRIGNPD